MNLKDYKKWLYKTCRGNKGIIARTIRRDFNNFSDNVIHLCEETGDPPAISYATFVKAADLIIKEIEDAKED